MYDNFTISFSNDHDMIIEEFDFYQQLPPKMQSQLIEHLFQNFLKRFDSMFAFCEEGFRNEMVINMYSRRIQPGTDIIYHGQRFERIRFLVHGHIDLLDKDGLKFFELSPGGIFGEY